MGPSTAKYRVVRFGVFEADLELNELRKHGIRILLPGQSFQVLTLVLKRAGEVVTREELRHALWPGEVWGDHDAGLSKAVNRVRRALSDSADTPRYLETIPRVGYRFIFPVEKPDEKTGTPTSVQPAPVVMPEQPAARRGNRIWPPIVIAAVLLASGAAVYTSYRAKPRGPAPAPEATPLTTYVGSELYPSFSPDGKEVAFAWDGEKQNGFHIYAIRLSGGGARQLTSDPHDDTAPVWSPDGGSIAFLRHTGEGKAEVRVARADGNGERRLAEIVPAATDHPLSWTRDPRWLVMTAVSPGNGPSALFLLSVDTGERRRLTSPPIRSLGDRSPAVSPDGAKLAFTRTTSTDWRDIFILPLSGDLLPAQEPRRITDLNRIIDTVAWTANGRELVFTAASTIAGNRLLYRVSAGASTPVRTASETGIEGVHPAVSPDGASVAYVRKNLEQTSIWRLEFGDDGRPAKPRQTRLISSTRRDFTADISPDGKRVVFSSIRSGATDVWVSDIDGSNLKRLTTIGASSPRWSPDGLSIVAKSSAAGQSDIYVIDVDSNAVRRLTSDPAADVRPSWSRDGKSIYFSSGRTGKSQIWKMPSSGGDAVQVTHGGGIYAVESFDGKDIYYTSGDQPAAIRRVSSGGGDEVDVVEGMAGFSGIALVRHGLCYLSSLTSTGAKLNFYDFASRTSRLVVSIDRPVHHFLSSSSDGRSVLYTQVDREDCDLMLAKLP